MRLICSKKSCWHEHVSIMVLRLKIPIAAVLCIHGYCYDEEDFEYYVETKGLLFALTIVILRVIILLSSIQYLTNVWGFIR